MGYCFHVTRAPEHWATNDGYEIAAEEWLRLVQDDTELALAGANGDYFTLWHGGSRYPDAWFNWAGGNIETKNPDAPMIQKMIQIGEQLNARLQGDDGEVYLSGGKIERDGKVMEGSAWDWRAY